MYNRDLDITPFKDTSFDLPEQVINFFYNPTDNVWVFEELKNYSLQMESTVKELTNIPKGADGYYVEGYLSSMFPMAEINHYESEEQWELDKQAGCYR